MPKLGLSQEKYQRLKRNFFAQSRISEVKVYF